MEDDEWEIEMPEVPKEPNLSWSQAEEIQARNCLCTKIRNTWKKTWATIIMSFISLCLEALDLLNTMALREEDQGSYQTVMKNERKFERYQHHIKKKKMGTKFFSQRIWDFFNQTSNFRELVDPTCSDGDGAQKTSKWEKVLRTPDICLGKKNTKDMKNCQAAQQKQNKLHVLEGK